MVQNTIIDRHYFQCPMTDFQVDAPQVRNTAEGITQDTAYLQILSEIWSIIVRCLVPFRSLILLAETMLNTSGYIKLKPNQTRSSIIDV